MKVKLKQHYQDAQVHLYPGQEYSGDIAPYLLQHRMAEPVEEPAPAVPDPTPEPEGEPEQPKSQETPRRARRATK